MTQKAIVENVARCLLHTKSFHARMAKITSNQLEDYLAANSHISMDEYQKSALAAASSYLGSALDALLTLRMQILDESTTPPSIKNATIASAGLLRMIIEPCIYAKWLLESKDANELRVRGYAVVWTNVHERLKHAKAIHEPVLVQLELMCKEILAEGEKLELVREGKNGPLVPLPSATTLLSLEKLPESLIAGLQQYFGSNIQEAEWIYNWLSGIVHGHIWVNTFKRKTSNSGISVESVSVDWNRTGLCLIYISELWEEFFRC